MAIFLSIAALFVLALLATSKRAYRVRRSRLGAAAVAGGWIAIAVGAILGPAVSGLITPDAVLRATPLLSVGLGWIGMMVGFQARRDILARLPGSVWRLSLTDAALSVALISAAVIVMARINGEHADPGVITVALLAAATIGWSMETRSLGIDTLPGGHQRAVLLRASGGLAAILAITTFGVASALAPAGPPAPVETHSAPGLPTRLGALAGASVIAVLLAIVAKEGLRIAGKRRAEMLVVFLGVVGLAAGISADLGISPLFPSMICGAVFANLRSSGPSDAQADTALFGRFILQAEHVIAVIFSLLAGILLDPRITIVGLIVVGAIVLIRVMLKPLAYRFADRDHSYDNPAARRAARFASIRQSPVAIAIAVSFFIIAPGADAQRLLTIVILVGVSCEILASVAVRRKAAQPGDGA